MSEYLVTLIPGAVNGTHGLYLMWPKGVGELYEGNVGNMADSSGSSRGVNAVLEAGIAVHDVTMGELLDSNNNTIGGDFPRLRHTIGAEEEQRLEDLAKWVWSKGLAQLNNDPVYNMLITTLFLLFVLTTVALLIFLLMRRPSFCPCCRDPFNQGQGQASTESQEDLQEGITYLAETHGIVVKKRMWDNPPPYESPPDYHSLSPEIIMDAKTLLLNASNTNIYTATSKTIYNVIPGVHTTCPAPAGHGRESPVSTTPLVSGTGASSSSPNDRDNRKISLQCPPNRPPRILKRTFSSPSSMPPTPVIQPPPHYDTLLDIDHKQISKPLYIETDSTKS